MPEIYPHLVEHWSGEQALTVGCNGCGRTQHIDDPEKFMEVESIGSCPDCGEYAGYVPAYAQGERCKGCGALAYQQPVDGCCSRRCQLQAEYAERLRRAA